MRGAAIAVLLLVGGCVDEDAGANARRLKVARAGMNAVRGLPGGMTASFTEVRLVGERTVCGRIDGNDGDGPRPFASGEGEPLVADPRDPATVRAVERRCAGTPVHRITSRNAQFSDLEVED